MLSCSWFSNCGAVESLLALPVALLFGGSEHCIATAQAVGVPVSSYLLATLPYIVSLGGLMIHYRKNNQSGGMPNGLRSIFSSTY
jgi:ABC-type uncharacterized transport system permease subunit